MLLFLLFSINPTVSLFISPAVHTAFDSFKQVYGRNYETPQEHQHRLECFTQRMVDITKRNANGGAIFGVNEFADLCVDEFRIYHNSGGPLNLSSTMSPLPYEKVKKAENESIDWRTKGAVTPVKNQGHCGSCWSFGSSGNMEGQWFIKTGQLISLSEQELVSCAHTSSGWPKGCDGGNGATHSYTWVIDNGGLDTEKDYPYTSGSGGSGTCNTTKRDHNKVVKFSSFKVLPKHEDQMLAWVLENGPISIHIDASDWHSYKGGIMTKCSYKNADHVVLVVGFGTEKDQDYWIVKNSWGPSWGESGYIRLLRGINACGITVEPATILV